MVVRGHYTWSSNWPKSHRTALAGRTGGPTLITLKLRMLPIAFCIAIIVCVAYCGWATWENCKPSNHRPTEYPSQEPVFDTPATGQLDQPVSAGYGHGTPVASAPPVEQSSGWTWSKATPAQQANRFNMCL